MQEMAANLEKAVREGVHREKIEPLLETFGAAHGKMVARLTEVFPVVEIRKAAGTKDTPKATAVYERMAELLADGDGEAVHYLDTENNVLREILGKERFGPFEQAVKQYDSEKALELMTQTFS